MSDEAALFLPSSFCLHPSSFVLPTAHRPRLADPGTAPAAEASPAFRHIQRQAADGENHARRADRNVPIRLPRRGSAAPDPAPTAHRRRWPAAARASVRDRFPRRQRRGDKKKQEAHSVCHRLQTAHGVRLPLSQAPRRPAHRGKLRGLPTKRVLLLRCRLRESDIRPAFHAAGRRPVTIDPMPASRSKWAAHTPAAGLLRVWPPRGGGRQQELAEPKGDHS